MSDLIPNEVFSAIFKEYLTRDPHQPRFPASSIVETDHGTPLLLSQVSRRWREATLQDPSLWSSIKISVPEGCPIKWLKGAPFFSFIKLWFSRSKGVPITIYLDLDSFYKFHYSDDFSLMKRLAKLTMQAMPRWHDVYLRFPYHYNPKLTIDLEIRETPLLRTFQVHRPSTSDCLPISQWVLQVLKQTPRLTAFNVGNTVSSRSEFLTGDRLAQFTLHFPKLQHLCIGEALHSSQAISILKMTPHLKTATFFHLHSDYRTEPSPSSSAIALPRLRCLQLHFDKSSRTLENMLHYLVLPGLISLTICGHEPWGRSASAASFFRFLIRSQCQLQRLELSFFLDLQQIVQILEQLPTLRQFIAGRTESFGLGEDASLERFLLALASFVSEREEFKIMPLLEELTFHERYFKREPGSASTIVDDFVFAIDARMTRPSPQSSCLRKLTFFEDADLPSVLPKLCESIQGLGCQDLDINIIAADGFGEEGCVRRNEAYGWSSNLRF